MDALPLDPGTYEGTYKLAGGEPSLDLINTLAWPSTVREHDWLEPPTNVTHWAVEVGLIDQQARQRLNATLAADPDGGTSQFRAVQEIRETLRRVIAPLAHGQPPSRGSVEELDGLLARTCQRRRLDPTTLDWSWADPATLEELMAPVIWNAAEVLTTVDRQRLAHCPSCDWLFHDTTRNRSRRWCDMADCGSRDKALRYYHRHKPPQP